MAPAQREFQGFNYVMSADPPARPAGAAAAAAGASARSSMEYAAMRAVRESLCLCLCLCLRLRRIITGPTERER